MTTALGREETVVFITWCLGSWFLLQEYWLKLKLIL